MSIKKLTFAVIAIVFAAMVAFILWQYHVKIDSLLDTILVGTAREEAKVVLGVEKGKRDELLRLASGLAMSNHAVAFVEEGAAIADPLDRPWIDESFFPNNDINFIAWFNRAGMPVYTKWYDNNQGEYPDIPAALAEAVDSGIFLPASAHNDKTGMLMVGAQRLWIASHRIFGSDRADAGSGCLVLGQVAENEVSESILNKPGIHLSVVPFSSTDVPKEVGGAAYDFSGTDYQEALYGSGEKRGIALVLADLENKPAVALLVEPRDDVEGAAIQASWKFQALVFIAALTAGLVVAFFLAAFVFSPLDSFNSIVQRLAADSYDLTEKPKGLGHFTALRASLLKLLGAIDKHNKELRDKDDTLLYRLKIEEALAKVSRNLLRDPEAGIVKSLRILGRNLDTDVVSYWQIMPDREIMHCLGTFRDMETGVFSGEYDFMAPVANWIVEAIRHDEHLIVDNVNDIPPDMEDVKNFITEYELKSFLGVPLTISGGRLGGLVAFGDIRAVRTWKKEDLRALEVVAELFVDMIEKARKNS